MEDNKIMTSEEVIEEIEATEPKRSHKGLKIALGIGLTALAGGIAYKFLKPKFGKIEEPTESEGEIEADYEVLDESENESTEE